MQEAIAVSIIASVPATLAAGAAWWAATKTNKKVATSNGHTMGQIVEANHELTKSVSRRQDELSKSLEVHIQDTTIHCNDKIDGINYQEKGWS